MGYDLVSFDLDGTLVDSACEIVESANRALEANGIAARPAADITRLIGQGTRHLMLELLARVFVERPVLGDAVRPQSVLDSFEHHYAAATGRSAHAYDGAHEALSRLKAAGVRLACVTNKEMRHAARLLQATGLDVFFDLLVGGDSLPHKKPHASVLRHVADTLRADTRRTAHVGDSSADVEAARNAGVAAWAVPYGYNAGRPIIEARPERIFPGLVEVADHVLRDCRISGGLHPEAPWQSVHRSG
jgi:phosphoglycolate phosphatase